MTDTRTHFSIPDVALHCIGGGEIDPADFRGQKLAVFFCPTDREAAAREIAEYRRLAEEFADCGVWLLGVLEGTVPPEARQAAGMPHLSLATDSDGCGWRYFEPALRTIGKSGREEGAAFFFERWGSLRRAWPSSGHAHEMLEAARERN
jgi:peroxiredoxin